MDTIVVTGCAGFIGSHVCELLLAKGYKVIGVDNFDPFYNRSVKENNLKNFLAHPGFSFYEADLCNGMEFIKENDIHAVIHLAAKAGVRPSLEDPEGYIRANITGTQKVHEFMLKKGIKKLVFASSSSVYGNNKKIPFSETDNVDNPISPYAFTKKAGELMNYTFHHLYDKDVVNLRFFTVYGPRQRPDLAIHKFVNKIDKNEPITLFGDGSTSRDYTYVEDTVDGILKALQYCINNPGVYTTVNLGNNNPVTLKDLVNTIYSGMNKQPNLIYEPMQPGDVDITFADISKAISLFDYHPATKIEEGISKFISWHKSKQ
ncbi:MAG: NAD-dependent epimerase/dehydratase family protein [Bacteroidetes bacterium]|nr:NAD-dependent epimerase/dehydratase family protein [Bacteroidota bacterium]